MVKKHKKDKKRQHKKQVNKAQAKNNDNAKDIIRRGHNKKRYEDYQGAIADFNEAIALNPDNATKALAYYSLGLVKGELGDYEATKQAAEYYQGAITDFNQAIDLNPGNATKALAYSSLGLVKVKLGEYDTANNNLKQAAEYYQGAFVDCAKAITLNSKDVITAEAYNNRGIARVKLGEYDTANNNLKQAAEYYQGAFVDCAKAITLNPDNATKALSYSNLGLVKEKLGDREATDNNLKQAAEYYQDAIDDYTQAITLQPDDNIKALAYSDRGITKGKLGDYEATNNNLKLATEYYQGAIDDYTQTITLNSKDVIAAEAYNNRGIARVKLGYYEATNNNLKLATEYYQDAIDDYTQAITLNSEAIIAAASALKDFGAKAITLNPEAIIAEAGLLGKFKIAEFYNNRGIAQGKLGEYEVANNNVTQASECYQAAAADFNQAIKHNSDHAMIYYNRGVVKTKLDSYEDAIADFDQANEYDEKLKDQRLFTHIAVKSKDITTDNSNRGELLKLLSMLTGIIESIQEVLLCSPTIKQVAHYTSFDVLECLTGNDADKNRFRLSDAADMDDPKEGRAFFEIMNELKLNHSCDIDDIEKEFYQSESPKNSACIGSFVAVKVQDNHDKKADQENKKYEEKLPLWRIYGKKKDRDKENASSEEDASGVCLIYDRHRFAKRVPSMLFSGMEQAQQHKRKASRLFSGMEQVQQSNSPIEPQQQRAMPMPPLYQVIYKGQLEEDKKLKDLLKGLKRRLEKCEKQLEEDGEVKDLLKGLQGQLDKGKKPETLRILLIQLKAQLETIKKDFKVKLAPEKQELLNRLVRELLDQIRFLFKADDYYYEQEVRVVIPPYLYFSQRQSNGQYLRLPDKFQFSSIIRLTGKDYLMGCTVTKHQPFFKFPYDHLNQKF